MISSILTNRFGLAGITAGVALLIIGGYHIALQRTQDRLDAAQQQIGQLQTEKRVITADRDNLALMIERQNRQIAAWRERAQEAEARAGEAAAAILRDAERLAEHDRNAGSTPEDLNRWFEELFH